MPSHIRIAARAAAVTGAAVKRTGSALARAALIATPPAITRLGATYPGRGLVTAPN
jgi:hypothetical protein